MQNFPRFSSVVAQYIQQERRTLEREINLEIFCLSSHTLIGNKNPFNSFVIRMYKVRPPLKVTRAASPLHCTNDHHRGSGATVSLQAPHELWIPL